MTLNLAQHRASESNPWLHGELVGRPAGPVAARWLDHGDSIMNPIRDVPGVQPGDIVMLHSGAGTSRICDAVTTLALAKGAKVVVLTQSIHALSHRIPYTGTTGRPVLEIADVTIDIGGALGDGGLAHAQMAEPVGPLSGSVGLPAAWAVIAHAVELSAQTGAKVPILT